MIPGESARAIAECISDPVLVVDSKGAIVAWNPAACETLGTASLQGCTLSDVVDQSSDELHRTLASWRRSRHPVPGALRLRSESGSVKVSCHAALLLLPGSEGLVLIHCRHHSDSSRRFDALNEKVQELDSEVRDHRRTEQALRESEQRFRAIFQRASDAMLIADDNGRYLDANHAACQLLGRTCEELLSSDASAIAPPEYRERAHELWREFMRTGAQTGVYVIVRPDGSIREAEYSAVRDFIEGRHLAILRDVTDRRRAESERERQAAALARSNAELEQFAYIASHDLQEPLRTISSFIQLIGRRLTASLDPETAELMNMVRGAVHRQQRIILDLLEFSRLGRGERLHGPVKLDEIVTQCLSYLRAAIDESHAEIRRATLPVVYGDSSQFDQLFSNLIGNALKFRSENPVIAIGAARHGDNWILSVADNGPGIEAAYFGRIFEPFRRLHGQDIPGSGIGLAICKRVVENHGGRIWLESEPGRGTTFFVELSSEAAPRPAADAQSASATT